MSNSAIFAPSQYEATANWPTMADEAQYYVLPQQQTTIWSMTPMPQYQHNLLCRSESSQMDHLPDNEDTTADYELYEPAVSLEDSIGVMPDFKYESPFFDSGISDGGTTWSSPDLRSTHGPQITQPYDERYLAASFAHTHGISSFSEPDHVAYDLDAKLVGSPMQDIANGSECSRSHSIEHQDAPAPTSVRRDFQAIVPKIRQRRSAGSRTTTMGKYRVGKRGQDKDQRNFACPFTIYGCTAVFSTKNEWKRHVSSQHVRLDFWRCDLCTSASRGPNDFNRKDLFYQHIRRMHPYPSKESAGSTSKAGQKRQQSRKPAKGADAKIEPTQEEAFLAEAAQRCHYLLRQPPQRCACLLCEHTFEGSRAWEDRLEHIGRHHEVDKKQGKLPIDPSRWRDDEYTEAWLSQEGVIERNDHGRWVLSGLS